MGSGRMDSTRHRFRRTPRAPQVAETHATLTNIAWWAGIGLLLIGLSDDPLAWWGRVGEAVFVVIVVLTGPIGIVLAPIVVWRWWRVRSNWTAALTAAWAISALLQVVVLRGQNRKVESVNWGADLGGVFVRRWFGPFTNGSNYVQSRLAGPSWSRNAWLITVLFAVGLLVVAIRGRDRGPASCCWHLVRYKFSRGLSLWVHSPICSPIATPSEPARRLFWSPQVRDRAIGPPE